MKAPNTLQEAIIYFADADNCLTYMVDHRWPNGVVCPTCGRTDVTFLKTQRKWQCKSAHSKRQFTAKVGTIFEDSPLGLEKWLPAVWMIAGAKNGISSCEISRALGVTQKTAWFMLHRIRLAMQSGSIMKMGGPGSNGVEVDETFVGGRIANMHKSKKARMAAIKGRSLEGDHSNKTVVMGMLDRSLREVRAKVVPNVRRDTLQAEILREVSRDSVVYTDEWIGYKSLREKEFIHEIVNHVDTYVRGQVHTNGIENFWSVLKRTLKGTYVAVEPYHLQRYVDEQVFRFNNRATQDNPLNDADRFSAVLTQVTGKRLTYAEVTGKVGETIN
jgi:transposase-like protein